MSPSAQVCPRRDNMRRADINFQYGVQHTSIRARQDIFVLLGSVGLLVGAVRTTSHILEHEIAKIKKGNQNNVDSFEVELFSRIYGSAHLVCENFRILSKHIYCIGLSQGSLSGDYLKKKGRKIIHALHAVVF